MNRRHKYRDKEKARITCNRQRQRYYGQSRNAPNKGRRWTEEEIKIIMEHSMTDREIAELIGRSVEAIQVKRCKWGK